MLNQIKSVLICNRGEIAVRIIRACKMVQVKTIAIFSAPDANAMHVKMADEAYSLGNGSIQETYLNIPKILEIAKKSKADAIHPGYGFLSENADFAQAVQDTGIIFIGPKPEIIDFLGDKIKAKEIARRVGIPVVPGSIGMVSSIEEARKIAHETGFPIIIKAIFGGGGRGMQKVDCEKELEAAFFGCQSIAEQFFGRKEVFIEKFITAPRHIEIQFIGDNHGNVVHLYDRECSIQRNHQKVIEEAPSFLPRAEIEELGRKVCDLGKELGYSNAGTAEFLWKDGNIYFNEVNPRIQVEHGVSEMITGIDLVEEQLMVADGQHLSIIQEEIAISGHAIEYRINAEDPHMNFLPQSGIIQQLRIPGGPNVRFDSALYQGYEIPNSFDSLIGKLMIWGRDRQRAITSSKNALKELVISGVKTNIELHQAIIESKEFKSWNLSTDFLICNKIQDATSHIERIKLAAIMQVFGEFNLQLKKTFAPAESPAKINKWGHFGRLEQVR